MIKELWPGVSLANYNNWYPLTGKIAVTPEKYIEVWPQVDDWFKTFALRAQNDINAYLRFVLDTFDISTIADKRVIETLVDMVFVCIEHWVYNRTPIEFNSNASLTYNNSQTQFNSFAIPTINIWDLHPSRMKIWANLTGLKNLWEAAQEGNIDPSLIDLNQYYSKTETDILLAEKANKSEIPDVSKLETKDDHKIDIDNLKTEINTKANKTDIPDVSKLATKDDVNKKQDELINQKNIASINNKSLLDGGNIEIKSGEKQFTDEEAVNLKLINNKSIFDKDNVDNSYFAGFKTPFKVISDTTGKELVTWNGSQGIFRYADGTPAIWILEDSIRFTYPSPNGNAVTLEYLRKDGTLRYGATSSLSEIATKADLPSANGWIPGECKIMIKSITNMPPGWVKVGWDSEYQTLNFGNVSQTLNLAKGTDYFVSVLNYSLWLYDPDNQYLNINTQPIEE